MRNLAITLGVLFVVLFCLSIYLGWLTVSQTDTAGGPKTQIVVTIDKERIKEDVAAARQKAEELKDKAKEAARDQAKKTVAGHIQAVDMAQGRVVVMPADEQPITVEITAHTAIRIAERPATLGDLRPGQIVTCEHTSQDGKHTCTALTVEAED